MRITYSADGHKNGNHVTLYDVCGSAFATTSVSESEWGRCDTPREQESFLLNIARRDYPSVNWESASVVEIY